MRFAVILGQPHLISNGMAYPVDINGDAVTIHEKGAAKTAETGCYSLMEIRAKFGDVVKYKAKRSKEK